MTSDVDSDVVARRRAVALAGHTGDVAAARAALVDPDPGVRAAALGALLRTDALHADDLRVAVADPSPVVRRRVSEVAAAAQPGLAFDLLMLTADEDATVVEVAAWALGELDPPQPGSTARLAALAGSHDDALVREAAVAALGALGEPAGLAAVLAATSDKATVRRRAVLALAAFEGPEVEAALELARNDRDAQVRQAAEDLLAEGCRAPTGGPP
ncbi:MAG: HEAT repeat domain-containing protein [Acidimicrobiales bacterium]